MTRRNRKMSMTFELERGRSTVEYVCEFEISPYDPGCTYGPPERCYPPEGGDIEDKAVYLETVKLCEAHRHAYTGRTGCRNCKKVLERRPELDELVSDDELIEYAGDQDDDRDWDNERKARLEG